MGIEEPLGDSPADTIPLPDNPSQESGDFKASVHITELSEEQRDLLPEKVMNINETFGLIILNHLMKWEVRGTVCTQNVNARVAIG